MAHTAEIIAVGTELLLGNIANTNAQMLSQSLSGLGVNVFWHTVVGDNPLRLREALETARRRADILLTIGGLGPTYDDLTKQTICEVFGQKLVLHSDIAEDIRAFYESALHVPMPKNNLQQAELPQGCTVFDNPVGTAPGCAFEAEGIHVLMLPGPPFECETMLRRHVEPYLRALSKEVIVSHDIMVFGMGESSVDQLLHDKMTHMENPTLATYAKPAEVRLRATAKADSSEMAQAMLEPVVADVKAALGDVAYGVDVSSLEEVCKQLLLEKGLSLATAESCTGGTIAQRLTALPGVSAVYRGGVVSYWTSVKADVLGVPQAILAEYGAVSEPTARAMAEGVCRVTGAEIGVSVTGVAGPDSDERGNPVGLVYLGLHTPDGTFCRRLDLGQRRRDRIRNVSANTALDIVRRYLAGLPLEPAHS
ncbi:competence/damage-inducible protein A [Oscillibacter ruminantium]|jgi:nicotinamide-nucleotide amidase|uniref:competence/damage-inducible protein A n=1 Tax=Oscillibacter ruminantium TaxID=1263547 RepID=UPI0002F88D9C|nr:competence/damage-inducible protein A [Oscillibacter ruminantium]MDN0031336.1 competence/damage-inducible protein A [Oscillibacter valericigenes]